MLRVRPPATLRGMFSTEADEGGNVRGMLVQRRNRIAAELEAAVADGWLVYDFRGSNPAFARLLGQSELKSTRRAFLYIPRGGEPRMLIHHVDAGNFARLGIEVQPYGGRDEMLVQLVALLDGARQVLMEYSPGNAIPYVSRVDAGTLELVRSLGVNVLSSGDTLAAVVAAWDEADVASHQRAADMLYRAKDVLFARLRESLLRGEEWDEVMAQRFLVEHFEREGFACDHPPIIAVNQHAGDPHYAPVPSTALPIRRGDLLLVDLWAREKHRADGREGAYADVTWMATAAERPDEEQLKVWGVVRKARDASVRLLEGRVGMGEAIQGAEVDRAARQSIVEAGYGRWFTHRTGHSIGWQSAHGDGVNMDDFETHDVRLIRPGASFSIEPGVYLNNFGVRSEINAVVTPQGAFRVTTAPQVELVRLV